MNVKEHSKYFYTTKYVIGIKSLCRDCWKNVHFDNKQEGQYRSSIASALLLCVKKGFQQGMFPGVTELKKAMLFGYGGGTEIQELSSFW